MNNNSSWHPLSKKQTRDLVMMLFFLMEHPFSSITEISFYPGYQKNTNTVRKLLNILLKNKLVYLIHRNHKEVFVVSNNISVENRVTLNTFGLQDCIFSRLNLLDFGRAGISDFVSYYKIKDFRIIPQKILRKRPLENKLSLEKTQDPIYQIIVKFLKNLFLQHNILILESERAEKQNLDEFYSKKQKQRREGQIFELLVDFTNFLDKFEPSKPLANKGDLLKKSEELDLQNSYLRYCYYNLAHNGPHSSVLVASMVADKMKQSFDTIPFGIQSIGAKKKPLFLDENGDPDIRSLIEVRRIQNADDSLYGGYDDIGDLSWAITFRKLTQRATFYDDESLIEKAESPFNKYYLDYSQNKIN